MAIRILTTADDLHAYDAWVKQHPQGTLWQSLERMQYCEAIGKEVHLYVDMEGETIHASALVVIDRTSLGLTTWEIPRGPLFSEKLTVNREQSFLGTIIKDAKRTGCISLYISPQQKNTIHSSLFTFHSSSRHVHAEATRMLDLTKSEQELLAQMHEKGRYNIRVAEKHQVRVEVSEDIHAYFRLARETGERDAFIIQPQGRYEAFIRHLPDSFLMLAYGPHDTAKPIAGLLGVVWNGTGIYYYGASSYADRALMAPYLLQWKAMQHCKALGCHSYDLLGVAPPSADPDHPWQGISGFKAKFGGSIVLYPPEQELVLKPLAKQMLKLKRKLIG